MSQSIRIHRGQKLHANDLGLLSGGVPLKVSNTNLAIPLHQPMVGIVHDTVDILIGIRALILDEFIKRMISPFAEAWRVIS